MRKGFYNAEFLPIRRTAKLHVLLILANVKPVADPGFPVGGGANLVGGANSQGGYVSKNLYVKTKESGPVGGARRRRPLDPPLETLNDVSHSLLYSISFYWLVGLRSQ